MHRFLPFFQTAEVQHSALCRNKSVSFISVETETPKQDVSQSNSYPILEVNSKNNLPLMPKKGIELTNSSSQIPQQTPQNQFFMDFKDTKGSKHTFQGTVYNFLERPTGWKCFIYHFTV